ncbi:hypothetical protein [Rubrivirga sp.]|uniref:hypothetical protein n=1 Tax=Rubrivirga sp. TaxID=1885344 RepID=UPI003B52A30F
MTGLSPSAARLGSSAVHPTRPAVAIAPAAPLTAAEEARIADAFPARPSVAQKLYGPGREVHAAPQLGTQIDVSA